MAKGPKNMFKAISDLRTPYTGNKAPGTTQTKNRDFLTKIFKRCAWWVHILFGAARAPDTPHGVIPAWEKLSDLALIPTCLGK